MSENAKETFKYFCRNCYNGSNRTLIHENKEVCPLCYSKEVKPIPSIKPLIPIKQYKQPEEQFWNSFKQIESRKFKSKAIMITKPTIQCLSCSNKSNEGVFIGKLCAPCHNSAKEKIFGKSKEHFNRFYLFIGIMVSLLFPLFLAIVIGLYLQKRVKNNE